MQYTCNEEIIEQLKLVLESILIVQKRNEGIVSVDDYVSSSWGMTVLDATLMRIQFIGEVISSIDKKTKKTSLFKISANSMEANLQYAKFYFTSIYRY